MTERIHSLDVLRGLALLGMLIVHFHDHSLDIHGFDGEVRTFIWRFVEGKSHGTFALLFGAGFAIQLRRTEARGLPFAPMYLRRVLGLALFGFVAHACFGFNVLLGYAAWALPLLLIRRWSTRALIATAIFAAASVGLYHVAAASYDVLTLGRDGAIAAAQAERATAEGVRTVLEAAVAQDSYGALFEARLRQMAWFYTQPFFFMPGATLTLFTVGFLAVRHRIFDDPTAHSRAIVAMMIFGFLSWLTANWILNLWTTPIGIPRISSQLHGLLGVLRDQWLTFTYVGGALLLLARYPRWLARLRPVGLAGRMALTNYLMQITVLDLLFSGYALHLPYIRPRYGPLAALLLFGVQVLISAAWVKHYRFGPAEWVWRSMTYGQFQPMKQVSQDPREAIRQTESTP
jgi:uncharacterized protein